MCEYRVKTAYPSEFERKNHEKMWQLTPEKFQVRVKQSYMMITKQIEGEHMNIRDIDRSVKICNPPNLGIIITIKRGS